METIWNRWQNETIPNDGFHRTSTEIFPRFSDYDIFQFPFFNASGSALDSSSSEDDDGSGNDTTCTSFHTLQTLFHHCVTLTSLEVITCIVLALIIVGIIVGNIYVILSVVVFDKMRTLSNGLIASLASADILLAIVVLPFSLQYEAVGRWTLGPHLCDLWITADVFCCTASILNIVVIAVDRYWLITRNVRYTHSTIFPRRKACFIMITLAWTVSALISCSPLLGWRKGTEKEDPTVCQISQDYAYTIFSTFGAFWFPLFVILAVYFKIFYIARQRAAKRSSRPYTRAACGPASVAVVAPAEHQEMVCAPVLVKSEVDPPGIKTCDRCDGVVCDGSDVSRSPVGASPTAVVAGQTSERHLTSCVDDACSIKSPRQTLNVDSCFRSRLLFFASHTGTGNGRGSHPAAAVLRQPCPAAVALSKNQSQRMRKSARTLGLIIGGFLICWLPFFLVATVMPFCPTCEVPPIVSSLVLWLGYSNSLLNPAIYAIWDKSFRRSFKRLTLCDVRA